MKKKILNFLKKSFDTFMEIKGVFALPLLLWIISIRMIHFLCDLLEIPFFPIFVLIYIYVPKASVDGEYNERTASFNGTLRPLFASLKIRRSPFIGRTVFFFLDWMRFLCFSRFFSRNSRSLESFNKYQNCLIFFVDNFYKCGRKRKIANLFT